MVYLTILLTILISILVYTFDPVPDRSEHNITQAEAYVTSFVNQHQAARDLVSYWLGYSTHNTSNGVLLSTGDNETRLQNFAPGGQIADDVIDNASSFVVAGSVPAAGSGAFKSIYLCLNNSRSTAVADSACKHRYVVTYAPGEPAWWDNYAGMDAVKKERWRRAIAQRTRGSFGCGVLTSAKPKYSSGSDKSWHWCHTPGKPKMMVSAQTACPSTQIQAEFCIDNGEGCKMVLPKGIKEKLQLDEGALVCVTPVKDVYITNGLRWQYDSIDALGEGIPGPTDKVNRSSLNGSPGNPTKWKTKKGGDLLISQGGLVSRSEWDKNSGKDTKSALIARGGSVSRDGDGDGVGDDVVLGKIAGEFTLTIVAQVPSKMGGRTIIGPVTWSGNNIPTLDGTPVALVYKSGNCDSSWPVGYDCFSLVTKTSSGGQKEHTIRYYKVDEYTAAETGLQNEIMSWTIVKRQQQGNPGQYQIYWYNGSAPVCMSDGSAGGNNMSLPVITQYNGIAAKDAKAMTLGGGTTGDDNLRVYALRYYNRPLTRREIYQNFRADLKRYNLARWDTASYYTNDYDVWETCAGRCNVDTDCLNLYTTCNTKTHQCEFDSRKKK